jgi:penicillin-binding protein 2
VYNKFFLSVSYWFLALTLFGLAGCSQVATEIPTSSPSPIAKLGAVTVNTTSVPDAKSAASAYLEAWSADDYGSMYSMLTSISRDAISAEDFEKFYRGVASEGALSKVDNEILSTLVLNPANAQVNYRSILHSELVGDLTREMVMNLSLENGQWRVQWDQALVMPELANGNYLSMERYVPSRAHIYDRDGHALVAQTDATAVGLRPALTDPEQADALYSVIQRLTDLSEDEIDALYESVPTGADWYVPLGELPASEVEQSFGDLSGLSGMMLTPYKARYYFDGGIAPHLVGYVSQIQQGQEEEYLRQGYRIDERVGQAGLEKWGEGYLSGKRGGALRVINPQGEVVTKLAETSPQPSQSIYTTLNKDFQLAAQQAMEGFRGAIVVLERDTGRVLAMVSSPGFDPNAFEPLNFNYYTLLNEIYGSQENPLLNRATQGVYPLGSVFKIMTMAAALESGRYTPDSTYQCGYFFEELEGVTLNDWTYDHFQQDGKTIPSGLLTLPEGLIRSCNPWFWHLGLDLFNPDLTKAVSDMARGFGLGSPTGIEGIEEQAGNIPDPTSQVDATNLAIGQGETLVTPLQVAAFTAAVGNGGTIYKPQVIERIVSPEGEETNLFRPEKKGELPISPENLAIIQEAMRGVVVSTDPYGTAWHRFTGLDIPVYGKTGTAQSGSGEPHAWFAGYTDAGRENQPDIAAAVIVENIGEGSDYAAPIFRRLVELYFYEQPAKLYPWESSFYVTKTPEPEATLEP